MVNKMKQIIKNYLINLLLLLYLEISFQLLVFNSFELTTIISILISTIIISLIITFITNIFNHKVNKILMYIIYFILFILYGVQIVFKNFFNTFFTFSLLGLSDQALSFADQAINLIINNIFYLLIFIVPFVLLIIFRKKITLDCNKKLLCIILPLILVSYLIFVGFLHTQKDKPLSTYNLYYEINNNELNVQKLGVVNAYYLDITRLIFGFEEKITIETPEETTSNQAYSYNITDLDMDYLKNKLNKNTYNYISNNIGTKQNEYTGLFKGKNLIYIVAESFSEIAIKEDLTPTLYKLANSGFVFNNFYTPNYLSTIGGEFQALTGLIPDKSILGTWRSGKNHFPYGLSNIFENNGYNTYAYHNHSGYFQNRNKYLKSLGFDNFTACHMNLNINCNLWPESDVEMMNATIDDYINSEQPFMTYYMTVSGHLEYNWWNAMSKKNKHLVEDLPYSEESKAYLAAQIELDRALEILINKLEESNKLDDTVIVLLADHYPYGLGINNINELSSYERDGNFEVNHNKLIIWNNNLEKVEVNKTCMSADVIPTVYNLFGINYDSRLFAGTDILSTTEGIAIFGNRSWITDKAIYNSITNKYIAKENINEDYVNRINNLVSSKTEFSKQIISNNYYKVIFK